MQDAKPVEPIDFDAAGRDELMYMVPFESASKDYQPRFVKRAEGSWIEFDDGRKMLDLHSQYMCIGMGHRNEELRAALHEAIDGLDYVCEQLSHERKARAAKLLCVDTMGGDEWAGAAKFVSSGSESVELALLTAQLVKNRPTVATTDGSYHGWTTGAARVTTLQYTRGLFEDGRTGETRVSPGAYPAGPVVPAPFGCEDEAEVRAVVETTEKIIRAFGVQSVAGLITELYHGAGGFLVPPSYPPMIREMCDRLGILWIDDEAIAGAGRTGKWWAFQHFGVTPDLLCTAKGITSSSVPAGAVVMSKAIAEYLRGGSWANVNTFGGHPLACAAICANVEIMLKDRVVEHAAELGESFGERLRQLVDRHPSAVGISGTGMAWTIELCKEPASGEKWVEADRWLNPGVDPKPDFMPGEFVARKCEDKNVLLFNFLPNGVTLAPPLRVTADELALGLEALDYGLSALDEKAGLLDSTNAVGRKGE
jgi:taurine---2-oxoglutarate transaminase